MRIYKMTATFGKLEQQTLTLEPGLNIITAPNEWGKSTWCAFLAAMFYGLDTRAKTTKTALADKERYEPWSGSPMAGRIDLNWKGRDITIERRTRKRIPLGEFRAYETASGLPVAELTAENCGQKLLGVEQSVYRRAGFIRHAQLPVTQDEALRRRLNALVTTGDESGAADRLADNLRELKNRCRYNRTGLIPQAEAEREELERKIDELDALSAHSRNLRERLDECGEWLAQLHNHRQTLDYAKMEADMVRVAQAKDLRDRAEQELSTWEVACEKMPPMEEAEQKVRELRALREELQKLEIEENNLPQMPVEPQLSAPFTGMDVAEARETVSADRKTFVDMAGSKAPGVLIAVGIFGLAAAALLVFLRAAVFGAVAGVTGLIALAWGIYERSSIRRKRSDLLKKYGSGNWKRWADPIESYEHEMTVYRSELREYTEITWDVQVRQMVLRKNRDSLCGGQDPQTLQEFWQEICTARNACGKARQEYHRAQNHLETLSAMVRPVEKPAGPDTLKLSEAETEKLLGECAQEQQRLQNRLGQYQGRMDILGDRDELQRQLEQKNRRIEKLEETYAALTIAQDTLTQARAELQRRFAPRITRRAQKLLSDMTGGRYHSVAMSDDFSLRAGADKEEILRDALWRSDGTMDQLYLALRLAVAEELTPEAPLVLDDVLVRFDDVRMKAAVELLQDLAQQKQILLFTCQGREETV